MSGHPQSHMPMQASLPNAPLYVWFGPNALLVLRSRLIRGALRCLHCAQEEESEYETESEDEAYAGRRLLKPVFVPKESREVRIIAQPRPCMAQLLGSSTTNLALHTPVHACARPPTVHASACPYTVPGCLALCWLCSSSLVPARFWARVLFW